jgi:hypothetical protein
MDINVKVKLESPELMAAILALAEALPQMKLGAVMPAIVGQAPDTNSAVHKIESKSEKNQAVTLEALRSKLAALSEGGKQAQVKTLIKKFGAKKLTEVAEENYEALLKEAEYVYLN